MALCLKSLINKINLELSGPIDIFEDIQGCISIANNPTCQRRTKHIQLNIILQESKLNRN